MERVTGGHFCPKRRRRMEQYLLVSAAPVLTGAKPSALMSFQRCCKHIWKDCGAALCQAAGLHALAFPQGADSFSILLYSRSALESHVKTQGAQALLTKYGYPSGATLSELLERLQARFAAERFPHEIGVFLGYPPEDVAAFIQRGGRDYLCCRYWKVYHNEKRAREAFRFIDEARERARLLLSRQMPLLAAAQRLAQSGGYAE